MTHHNDTVVGVFLDESMAQRAIQSLQSAGFNARIADESAIRSFRNTGLEDEVISLYESRYNEGNTIVVEDGAGRGEDALGLMLQSGAEYMNLHSAQARTQGQGQVQAYDANYYRNLGADQRQYGQVDVNTGRARTAEEMRLQLREETLTPVKQAVQAGEVQVNKVVHEKQQEVPVNLRHEEVVIERRAADRPVEAGEITDTQDEVIRIPVYEEQAELQKQARVREEVVIGKDTVEEQQTLTGTARHEHADVQQAGNVEVRGGADADVRTTRTETTTYEQS